MKAYSGPKVHSMFRGISNLLCFIVLFAWAWLCPVMAQQDPIGCTGSGLGIALFVDKPQAHIGDTLNYSALVYNTPFPACKASFVRAWVVTPDGVTNQITLKRNVLNPGDSDLYNNVATYVIRAQDIVGGLVKGAAGDVAKIHQNETLSDGEAAQTVNTLIVTPCIQITAVCTNGVGQAGNIAFSGTVNNCGDIDLVGVTVTNVVDGVPRLVFGPVNLAAGQATNFVGSYIPVNPCNPSSATYIAAGADSLTQPKTVTATTTSACTISLTPGLAMGQSCPAVPANGGGALIYSGAVTNTGNVVLTNLVVVSDQPAPGTVIYTLASLAPNAVATFTGQFTAPTNVCSVTISLQSTATSLCGQAVSANSSSTCPIQARPAIVITQNCPANPTAPGSALNYTGTVRNSGDITLRDVVVTSADTKAEVFRLATLEPGASAPFTGSLTTQADSCSVTSTLLVSAKDACQNQVVSNTVITVCNLTTSPGISIAQNCPATPPPLGGNLSYTAILQNTGNVTLQNITVVSERPNNTVVYQIPSLAVGATTNFTWSYPVPANLGGCSITNTLTVTAADKCSGKVVSAAATTACPVQSNPKISIVANCPAAAVAPGALLTYSGTVSNPGDVTLMNVTVTATQPAAGAPVLTITSLAPGASTNFTGSYTAPVDTCSSSITLTATGVDACAGSTIRDSMTQTCPLSPASAVSITVNCSGTSTAPGKTLVLTGTIVNTGNITLTNVSVEIDRPNLGTQILGPVTLAPGVGMPFTGSFVVPTNINSCFIQTTAIVRGYNQCNGALASSLANAVCPVQTTPGILLTTQCPGAPTPQGGLLTFSGTVKNTGNITLTNVVITSNRPSNGVPVITIDTLLPDQTTNFTGSFVVPVNCCEVVTTLTASGFDICGTSNVVDTATMICPVLYTPGVRISRVCPTDSVKPGDQLNFTGAVTNTGNITLTGVTVVSTLLGPTKPLLGPIDLGPGESRSYTSKAVVPADFCGADTVTVTGQSICGNLVTDAVTSTCPVQTSPGISVVNVPSGALVSCGSKAGRGTIANTGNVSLTDVMVYSSQPAGNTPVLGPIVLAPGEVRNFTYNYSAPQDCNCCEIAVTLTAVGKGQCDGQQVSNTSTLVVPVQTAPNLAVMLDCANQIPGSSLVTGVVSNSGDIALSNVVVTANLPAAGTMIVSPINLAPGESQLFIADVGSTDPTTIKSLSVDVTGNSICGGGQVRATAACTAAAPGPLTISVGQNQSVTLSWSAVAGTRYRIEYKKSLSDAAWTPLGDDVVATSSTDPAMKVDGNQTDTTRFYRVIVVE